MASDKEPRDPRVPLGYSNLPDPEPSEARVAASAVVLILLTTMSCGVVYKSANDEPYMAGIQSFDLILHLVGVLCILGWVGFIIAGSTLLRRGRGWLVAVIALLCWAVVNLFYLGATVIAYVEDVTR